MTAIRSIAPATAFAAFVAVLAMTSAPAPASAASQQAKYCIMRYGGGEGGVGRTSDCVYSDYQLCLQAAASGGNCVQNIDYRGDASASQPAAAPRARRRGR